jgi:hypothetical protein
MPHVDSYRTRLILQILFKFGLIVKVAIKTFLSCLAFTRLALDHYITLLL